MKILNIISMLLVVVAVASVAGCAGKAWITGNDTQEASEQVTPATEITPATETTSSTEIPASSVMPTSTNSVDSTSSTVVDVVCKMEIDKRTAEFRSEYKGTTYYFCAISCKNEFDENPEKFINTEDTEEETQEASEQVTFSEMNDTDSISSTVVDVVCKMEIDKRTAEFTSEYKGTTYYFCALSCKNEFDENSEKFMNSVDTENEIQIASGSC